MSSSLGWSGWMCSGSRIFFRMLKSMATDFAGLINPNVAVQETAISWMLNWMEISRIRFRWQRIWNFKDTNTCHRQGYEKNTWDILRRWVTWRWLFLSPWFPAPSLQEITSTTLILRRTSGWQQEGTQWNRSKCRGAATFPSIDCQIFRFFILKLIQANFSMLHQQCVDFKVAQLSETLSSHCGLESSKGDDPWSCWSKEV